MLLADAVVCLLFCPALQYFYNGFKLCSALTDLSSLLTGKMISEVQAAVFADSAVGIGGFEVTDELE